MDAHRTEPAREHRVERVNRPPALIFGVPIADLSMSETVDRIGRLVSEGRERRRTHQVSTVNIDFLTNALAEPELLEILQAADLCIADGMPLLWVARLLDMELRERVAGADLVPELIDRSQVEGWRIHVFGSSPDVAERSRVLIAERWPDAAVTIDPGPMIPDVEAVDASCIASIVDTDADILCVALGNPKQEYFIRAHGARLGVPVMIGIGGTLDMLVGERKRAPQWMQRTGLEWVARAAQEPRRLGVRYAHDIRVMTPAVVRAWRAHRRTKNAPNVKLSVGDSVAASLREIAPLDPHIYSDAVDQLTNGARLDLRAEDATTLTDRAAAAVTGLVGVARSVDAPVTWHEAPTPELRAELGRRGMSPAMWGLE